MESDIDLHAFRLAVLDQLRGKPCRERITDVEVCQAHNDWGWSARAVGEFTNDDKHEFIAAKFAVNRAREFPPN